MPDFRYVGLEPIPVRKAGAVATSFALGAGVTMALQQHGAVHAVVAGVIVSVASALALRGATTTRMTLKSARMAIVPWGVLVHADESPRILRWAALRELSVSPRVGRIFRGQLASRVTVVTEHDRFEGEALGIPAWGKLGDHLDAYAREQSSPLALDLDGELAADVLEPECESLLAAARTWLTTGAASRRLGLMASGYRRVSTLASTSTALIELRDVLRDRTPKRADPRAFAAVLAAELSAESLVPELLALTQCPHPLVAAVARGAAQRLGVPKAKTGSLDEVAPFFTWGTDRDALERWTQARRTPPPT